MFGSILLVFLVIHTILLFKNKTTIENMEIPSNLKKTDEESIGLNTDVVIMVRDIENPYSIGWKLNFIQVMGGNPWFWFVPVYTRYFV